jgi:hypothetical protein
MHSFSSHGHPHPVLAVPRACLPPHCDRCTYRYYPSSSSGGGASINKSQAWFVLDVVPKQALNLPFLGRDLTSRSNNREPIEALASSAPAGTAVPQYRRAVVRPAMLVWGLSLGCKGGDVCVGVVVGIPIVGCNAAHHYERGKTCV